MGWGLRTSVFVKILALHLVPDKSHFFGNYPLPQCYPKGGVPYIIFCSDLNISCNSSAKDKLVPDPHFPTLVEEWVENMTFCADLDFLFISGKRYFFKLISQPNPTSRKWRSIHGFSVQIWIFNAIPDVTE